MYAALKKDLPQVVDVKNAITISIPLALVKRHLANMDTSTVVFGFIGKIHSRAPSCTLETLSAFSHGSQCLILWIR